MRQFPQADDNVSVISTSSSKSSRSQIRSAKAKRLIAEHRLRVLKEKHQLERQQKDAEIQLERQQRDIQIQLERSQKDIKNQQELLEQESLVEEARIEETVFEESDECTESEQRKTVDTNLCNRVCERLDPCDQVCERVEVSNREQESVGVCEQTRDRIEVCNQVSTKLTDSGVSMTTGSAPKDSNDNKGKSKSFDSVDPENNSSDISLKRLASVLQESICLPKPELLTFSGSALDYCKFIRNFETNIETNVADNRLRLSYLIQYCEGEAKVCIEDCVLLAPDQGYKRAREILQSRYGRPHVIARTYIDRLVNGPQVRPSNIDDLATVALDMQKCEMTLTQLGFVSDLDCSENLRRILQRLPMHMRIKWADIAHNIYESGREPRFPDLTRFIDERSRVACSMYDIDIVKPNSSLKPSALQANPKTVAWPAY